MRFEDLIGLMPERKKKIRSAETIARHKASMRATALARYKDAFDHFGGTATTTDLARYLTYHPSSLGQKLRKLDNVEVVGQQQGPHGRPTLVWKWN